MQTYPDDWLEIYTDNAYALRDPLVFWGLGVKGQTRWSDIGLPDPFDILGQARQFGPRLRRCHLLRADHLAHRSSGLARADREFTDDEIDADPRPSCTRCTPRPSRPTELTPAQVEALRLHRGRGPARRRSRPARHLRKRVQGPAPSARDTPSGAHHGRGGAEGAEYGLL